MLGKIAFSDFASAPKDNRKEHIAMFNQLFDLRGIDLRNPSHLDRWKLMQNAKQRFRASVPNPNEETLIGWELQDVGDEIMRKYYERLDAEEMARKSADDDDYNISFKSEVKVKK